MDTSLPTDLITVLMIDDDAELSGMVGELLLGQGMQLRSAATAALGLAALAQRQPDVLLLDLMLPDAPGVRDKQASIVRNVQAADRLVGAFLDLARASASRRSWSACRPARRMRY